MNSRHDILRLRFHHDRNTNRCERRQSQPMTMKAPRKLWINKTPMQNFQTNAIGRGNDQRTWSGAVAIG
jgi:hypothetical protein